MSPTVTIWHFWCHVVQVVLRHLPTALKFEREFTLFKIAPITIVYFTVNTLSLTHIRTFARRDDFQSSFLLSFSLWFCEMYICNIHGSSYSTFLDACALRSSCGSNFLTSPPTSYAFILLHSSRRLLTTWRFLLRSLITLCLCVYVSIVMRFGLLLISTLCV